MEQFFWFCCWPQLSKLGLPPLLCQIHMQTQAEEAEMAYFEHVPKPGFNFKLRLLGRASKHNIVLDINGNSVKKTCLLSQTGNWNWLHSCSLEPFFCTGLPAVLEWNQRGAGSQQNTASLGGMVPIKLTCVFPSQDSGDVALDFTKKVCKPRGERPSWKICERTGSAWGRPPCRLFRLLLGRTALTMCPWKSPLRMST